VELAISDRLRVVTGGVEFGQHRFATMVHRLTAAQRVATVEEQARIALAQLA
jgi:hypothetical protein